MSAGTAEPSAGSLPAALLELAQRAAAAGAAVLAGRKTAGLEVTNKGDSGDWVTAF
ncbi:MAG TPA: inositol monophosphatase, partial [Arthrobacter sp.]|nr:inositol monophosphatase [Arthrobacter sp.]